LIVGLLLIYLVVTGRIEAITEVVSIAFENIARGGSEVVETI
jgi:hypothetical protein